MKAKPGLASLVLAGAALILLFQNCGGYATSGGMYDEGSTACSGTECETDAQAEQLKLVINNADPLLIISSEAAVDIGGTCDAAEFAATRVLWLLEDGSGNDIATGYSSVGCNSLGRFRLRIDFPASYAYNQIHTLSVTLKGVRDSEEVENPLGLHKKQISIVCVNCTN